MCGSSGRFRWQRWRWAICTVIRRTSAFQELHSTHGRPKQPQPELCGAAVNKSLSSQTVCVCVCGGRVRLCDTLLFSCRQSACNSRVFFPFLMGTEYFHQLEHVTDTMQATESHLFIKTAPNASINYVMNNIRQLLI